MLAFHLQPSKKNVFMDCSVSSRPGTESMFIFGGLSHINIAPLRCRRGGWVNKFLLTVTDSEVSRARPWPRRPELIRVSGAIVAIRKQKRFTSTM